MSICGFIGNLPEEFPWEYGKESPPHAEYLRQVGEAVAIAVEYSEINEFCCRLSDNVDLDFAEAVLYLKENKYPKIKLICVVDSERANRDRNKQELDRRNAILEKADEKRHLRDFSLVDTTEQLIAAWNGQKSGPTWETLLVAMQKEPIYFIRLNDIKEDTDEPNGKLKRELREAEESSKRSIFKRIAYTHVIKELIATHPDPVAAFETAIKNNPAFARDITDLAEMLELNLGVDR